MKQPYCLARIITGLLYVHIICQKRPIYQKRPVCAYKRPMKEPYCLARIITGLLYIHITYRKRPMKEAYKRDL